MRSFNGDFPPWRCSGRQRRIGERRRHPLRNKPWKKELHHQECALDKKLEKDALMEEKKESRGKHKIEGIKEGGKWNFESVSHKTFIHQSYNKCYTCFYL